MKKYIKVDNSTKVVKNGIGFWGLLQLLFIAFKIIGVVDWSWGWVLSPIWLPWVIVAVIAITMGLICLAVYLVRKLIKLLRSNKNKKRK